MKNDLQQRVDQQLACLTWDDRRSGRVISRLHEARHTTRPRLTAVLAAALVLVMLTATAAAMLAVRRAPEADAIHAARQAVMDQYGLTADTMGTFYATLEQHDAGWTVTFLSAFRELAGSYTVNCSGENLSVSWTHDAIDPAVYADGSLDAPVWGQAQLQTALHDQPAAWAHVAELPTATPAVTPEEPAEPNVDTGSVWMLTRPSAAKAGDIPLEEAVAAAAEAIREELGLPESIPVLDQYSWEVREDAAGQRLYEFSVTVEADGVTYCIGVYVHAENGSIVFLGYDTIGNG